MKYTRRKTLKISALGLGLPAIGTASAQFPSYSGLAYDPVTHEILGEASSDVIFNQNHANGVLKIVNENLAIDAERIRSGLNSDTTSQSFNEQSYRSVSHASISDIISPNTSDLNDVSVEGKSADQTTVKIISEGDNSEYMTGYYTQLVSTELHFS